jgi:hypothetical protein
METVGRRVPGDQASADNTKEMKIIQAISDDVFPLTVGISCILCYGENALWL